MPQIREILAVKGLHLSAISPQATVLNAAVLMNDQKIGSLLVMHDGQLVGILTERDLLRRVLAEERSANSTLVDEVMTRDVICCRPHTTIEEARGVMMHRRVRHLPVMDEENQVIGLISIGDLNASQVTEHEKTIYLLESYIKGQA